MLKTKDVTEFLKSSHTLLHEIIEEVASYLRDDDSQLDVVSSVNGTSFEFDGSIESFGQVVSKIGLENQALKSAELEWIFLVLRNICDHFNEHYLSNLKGILIVKNKIPLCFVKNTSAHETHLTLQISYESIRKIVVDFLNLQKAQKSGTTGVVQGIKYFLFGVTFGVAGYMYLDSKFFSNT